MKVTLIPIEVVALKQSTRTWKRELGERDIRHRMQTIRTTAQLRSARILKKP